MFFYGKLAVANRERESSMYLKEDLLQQLKAMNINPKGTVLMHSSMKAIGEVEDGADGVLDVLMDYMKDGLLVLPTHTWSYIKAENPNFYVEDSKTCVGILTELFRKRPNVIRSLHPTHSVAAIGKDAVGFVEGNEQFDTPCARGSSWGKLLDRQATIILVGVDLKRNTFIHGIEEWVDIPGRMTDDREQLFTILPDGTKISVPSRRHSGLSWSEHFWKVEDILAKRGAIQYGELGNATVLICDTVQLNEDISAMLAIDPDLFSDNEPIEEALQQQFLAL